MEGGRGASPSYNLLCTVPCSASQLASTKSMPLVLCACPQCCVHGQWVVALMMSVSWAIGFYGLYVFAVKKAGMQYARDPANLQQYKKRA